MAGPGFGIGDESRGIWDRPESLPGGQQLQTPPLHPRPVKNMQMSLIKGTSRVPASLQPMEKADGIFREAGQDSPSQRSRN